MVRFIRERERKWIFVTYLVIIPLLSPLEQAYMWFPMKFEREMKNWKVEGGGGFEELRRE
ncbi:transmembrane protein, putative [Medicago truncatula]|uniref:Transmembrane protein, putative n=1 Tax=Medicago truncatula TaxID=3880 RepID=A0A072UHN9_MEDTR|nr:transmembrane protein, putative [Medicago truncatula]